MKLVVEFNDRINKIEDVEQILRKEDFNTIIKEIIDDKTIYGKNIVNWKGETVFTIKFEDFEEMKNQFIHNFEDKKEKFEKYLKDVGYKGSIEDFKYLYGINYRPWEDEEE